MKERELSRAEKRGIVKKPHGDRKCCAECDCEAQSLESIRNMCTSPEEHMIYVYIGKHVILKTCSRKPTISPSIADKATKRVRDQIDNYSDSLSSLHHKLDQIIAFCYDKKEREEVFSCSKTMLCTCYQKNMFTEHGRRREAR